MERFTKGLLLLILIAMTVSCKTDQQKSDGYKVKLRRDDAKGLTLYDTTLSLDYLTEESRKNPGISNFEFFDRFDYPIMKSKLETSNHLTLFNDSISISIKIRPFDTLQFKSNLASDSNYYADKSFYGGLGDSRTLPSYEISSISIRVNDKLREISYDEYENMFDPNIVNTDFYAPTKAYLTDKGEVLLQMDNSVGAEFYYLIFLFDKEGNLKKRIVKNVL